MKNILKHKYFSRFPFDNKSFHNKKRLICNEIIKLESKNNKFYINTFSKELSSHKKLQKNILRNR